MNTTNSNQSSANQSIILSEREIKILHYLKEGYTSKQIGEKLFTSQKNVERIMIILKRKCNCSNKAQLISFSYENNIVKPKAA